MANATNVQSSIAASSGGGASGLAGIHPDRLFIGSCFALIATSVFFAVSADIMGSLKEHFVLTNEQVGFIVGAGTWGFTISTFCLGSFCDIIGMRHLLRMAFVCHFAGVLMMIFAPGYWVLWSGALVISLGNGLVEAVCNPLITTFYPDRKTQKLNQFHVWFPGGITLGAIICYLIGAKTGLWQMTLGLILIPAVIYGVLFTGQKFPATESKQAGVSFGGMFRETFSRPLFWLLLGCMCLTASVELGTNRWVPEVLKKGILSDKAILVLAYINILMAVLRFCAGPIVHRLSPIGILLGSAILSGIGLYWLSMAGGLFSSFLSVTIFSLGICYFWPTMLGVTSERVPKGGALALGLMGGMGMLIVGVVTTPQMGKVIDKNAYQKLDVAQVVTVLEQVSATYPELAAKAPEKIGKEIMAARDDA